ncbi:hypothetical protein [Haladaptatus sp. NG-WS-4]
MSDTPGWQTLARALVWSELRGRGWRLFTFPIGAGVLFLGMLGLTAVLPGALTGGPERHSRARRSSTSPASIATPR